MDKDFENKRKKMISAIGDFYNYYRLEYGESKQASIDMVSKNAEYAIRKEEEAIALDFE